MPSFSFADDEFSESFVHHPLLPLSPVWMSRESFRVCPTAEAAKPERFNGTSGQPPVDSSPMSKIEPEPAWYEMSMHNVHHHAVRYRSAWRPLMKSSSTELCGNVRSSVQTTNINSSLGPRLDSASHLCSYNVKMCKQYILGCGQS